MGLRTHVAWALLSLALGSAACQAGESVPGAREPLTFRDMGLYGGWNEYWLAKDCPFTFFIVQAWVSADGKASAHGMSPETSWGQWLKRARAKGKRIIADVQPLGWGEAQDKLAHFKAGLDKFMEGVDERLLYAITLGEENIYWNGHHEVLREMYRYVKAQYDVPIYQWYSPYAGPPGFGWPHLPADGWVIDEYAHGGPSFERFVRSYAVHQLPVIHIVWAAPLMRSFDWEKAGDPAFDWQLSVCRKYGVPCAFFMWEGHGNVWGWSQEALPPSRAVYQRAVEWARQAAQTRTEAYPALWDDLPRLQPLPLACLGDGTVSFEESFRTGGGLIAAGAAIQGFRDLRWEGGALELRPRQPGVAQTVLLYPLACDFPLRDLQVEVAGRAAPRLRGRLEVAASPDGDVWTQAQRMSRGGVVSLNLSGAPHFEGTRRVYVRVTLTGRCSKAGEVPIAVERLKVTARFVPPERKVVSLRSAPGVPLRWEANMTSLPFTAEIENQKELEVSPSGIGTHGVAGYPNTVVVRQRFACEGGTGLRRVVSRNYADEPNFNATNLLGISLDGKTVLVQQATSGRAANAALTLELKSDKRFANVKEFWVHLTMRCGCGVKTATTNRITALTIEGVGAQAAPAKE